MKTTNPLCHSRKKSPGFTLVEMLAVIGVIAVLISFTIPAIQGLALGTGRRGALNLLTNTFEQARVTALEQSANIYVGIADKEFPDSNDSKHVYRSLIIFRDRKEGEPLPVACNYVPLTKWITLPEGISIRSEVESLVSSSRQGEIRTDKVKITQADGFPAISETSTSLIQLPVIQFSSTGSILRPVEPESLKIVLYEGHHTDGKDRLTRQTPTPAYDCLKFSRFTGRARWEEILLPSL